MTHTIYEDTISSNSRLLILSCSEKKRSNPGSIPALERYDGPAFRVMNKFIRVCLSEAQLPDTYILSAKFGLISADKPIPHYDHRMTPQRVEKLQQPTLNELQQILNVKQYQEFFISMGKDYLRVLDGYKSLTPTNLNVTVSQGSMGCKLAELRNWLHKNVSVPPDDYTKVAEQGRTSLRGIEITLTPEQIMEKINDALAKGNNIPKYHIWYVQVGDKRVPLKWIVNQLTGLPVSAFHTNEAKRVLQQLGVEICLKG
ncbi:hypothetical protein F4054_11760 [Candidatus Poribacteria bacterium]|nr:hypothetical protein [Candidatus Poribacteria bacterium]MYK22921.1 hypothetical protein [Candidatus Poribacteria bacterium]